MPRRRLDLREAAEILGASVDAVRKRIQRGTLESEKVDGKVYVWLDDGAPRSDTDIRSYPRCAPTMRPSGSNSKPSGKPTPKPVGCLPLHWRESRLR
jgi:hypothetical protein